jgi:16S rRNA C967 or C1407 C5-methylase (RsmB/RsmF family)
VKHVRLDFDAWYAGIFGERWLVLKAALEGGGVPVAFSQGLRAPYYLDAASLAAVLALGETGDARVLDMCAAPGGKTLVLASSLGPGGSLTSNERSADRRRRLRRVLDEHLPAEVRRRVRVTGHDAARWGLHEKDAYDMVLLDAPCSSERRLIHNPRHLDSWSPARIRHLAQQAYAMLLAALDAAKPGGLVLYSTCALCEEENDGVVRRAEERRPGSFTVTASRAALPQRGPGADNLHPEATRFGKNIWPDTSGGAGPIYFALLKKEG